MADRPIPIILNPAARSTQAAKREEMIRSLSPIPEVHMTTGPGEATAMAEKLARDGHELVVAGGGDGTMNEVLQGICRVNTQRKAGDMHTAIGVLPLGTMNVFSLELGMPGHDIAKCWGMISSGRRQEVDLWKAGDAYFVQLAGIGFDAQVIQETPWEMKKRYGPLSYVMSAVQVLQKEPPVLTLSTEEKPDSHGSVILVGNGKHYGGPVQVFNRASNTDGLLDVLIFRGLGGWEFAQLLRAILVDGYAPSNDIDYLQLREFTVTSDRDAPMELDGELCGSTPVTFHAAPFRLSVAV